MFRTMLFRTMFRTTVCFELCFELCLAKFMAKLKICFAAQMEKMEKMDWKLVVHRFQLRQVFVMEHQVRMDVTTSISLWTINK